MNIIERAENLLMFYETYERDELEEFKVRNIEFEDALEAKRKSADNSINILNYEADMMYSREDLLNYNTIKKALKMYVNALKG